MAPQTTWEGEEKSQSFCKYIFQFNFNKPFQYQNNSKKNNVIFHVCEFNNRVHFILGSICSCFAVLLFAFCIGTHSFVCRTHTKEKKMSEQECVGMCCIVLVCVVLCWYVVLCCVVLCCVVVIVLIHASYG